MINIASKVTASAAVNNVILIYREEVSAASFEPLLIVENWAYILDDSPIGRNSF